MDTRNISNLYCGFINIQSVGNKTIKLRELIKDNSLDVLALAETWLNELDSAKIQERTPSTHIFMHLPKIGKRGGNVDLFVLNRFTQIKLVASQKFNTFEHIALSFLISSNQRIIFIVVYRPPQTSCPSFIDEFSAYLKNFDHMTEKFLYVEILTFGLMIMNFIAGNL